MPDSFDPSVDYYATLGVLPSADPVVIKAAYRALVQRYHPDKIPGHEADANQRVAEINAAFAVLSDPVIRSEYDAAREMASRSSSYFDDGKRDEEPPFDPLEGAWSTAALYFPDLPSVHENLSKISWRLAYAFKICLIETKAFQDRLNLATRLEDEFMRTYFGTNEKYLPLRES